MIFFDTFSSPAYNSLKMNLLNRGAKVHKMAQKMAPKGHFQNVSKGWDSTFWFP